MHDLSPTMRHALLLAARDGAMSYWATHDTWSALVTLGLVSVERMPSGKVGQRYLCRATCEGLAMLRAEVSN